MNEPVGGVRGGMSPIGSAGFRRCRHLRGPDQAGTLPLR